MTCTAFSDIEQTYQQIKIVTVLMTPNVCCVPALLTVSNKTGLDAIAQRLHSVGLQLIASGGTAKAVQEAGIHVRYIVLFLSPLKLMMGVSSLPICSTFTPFARLIWIF